MHFQTEMKASDFGSKGHDGIKYIEDIQYSMSPIKCLVIITII